MWVKIDMKASINMEMTLKNFRKKMNIWGSRLEYVKDIEQNISELLQLRDEAYCTLTALKQRESVQSSNMADPTSDAYIKTIEGIDKSIQMCKEKLLEMTEFCTKIDEAYYDLDMVHQKVLSERYIKKEAYYPISRNMDVSLSLVQKHEFAALGQIADKVGIKICNKK